MYSASTQIHRWLSSTTDSDRHPLHPAAHNLYCDRAEGIACEARHCKRHKVHYTPLPSPPPSQPLTRTVMSASSGRKRTRDDRDNDPSHSEPGNAKALDEMHDEETPRASKFLLMQHRELSDRGSPSQASSASNRSASISSHSVSISNRSSPTKQFRNAEMQETGFVVGSFRLDKHPQSLKTLRMRLRDIGNGHAILPASLQHEVRFISSPPPH